MTIDFNSRILKKLIEYLLVSVDQNGRWEDSRSLWTPMTTSFCTSLFLDSGFDIEDEWFFDQNGNSTNLNQSLKYLNNQITAKGKFGVDLWDELMLAQFILEHNLKSHFSNYQTLYNQLIHRIDKNEITNEAEHWSGPSFYAAAVDFLRLSNKLNLHAQLTKKLTSDQNKNGSWSGQRSKAGDYVISPIYDTAQAVISLTNEQNDKYNKSIEKGLRFLTYSQEPQGNWKSNESYEILYSSWAMLSLVGHPRYVKSLSKSITFLESRMTKDGRCVDLLGTVMFAKGLVKILKSNPSFDSVGFKEYVLHSNRRRVIKRYEQKISDLEMQIYEQSKRLKDFEGKFKNADIFLTKTQAFFFGLLVVVISLLGSLPILKEIITKGNSTKSLEQKEEPQEKKNILNQVDTLKNSREILQKSSVKNN